MSKTTNNISLNISERKEYTINGSADKVIKLNPNDMRIVGRLDEVLPQLNEAEEKYRNLFNADDKEDTQTSLSNFSKSLLEIDKDIREIINYLFDYDVCSVCADGGSMLDLQDGEYRFSVIITTLLSLYTDTITEETNKMIKKMQKYTDKYTAQDHKKKGTK